MFVVIFVKNSSQAILSHHLQTRKKSVTDFLTEIKNRQVPLKKIIYALSIFKGAKNDLFKFPYVDQHPQSYAQYIFYTLVLTIPVHQPL